MKNDKQTTEEEEMTQRSMPEVRQREFEEYEDIMKESVTDYIIMNILMKTKTTYLVQARPLTDDFVKQGREQGTILQT